MRARSNGKYARYHFCKVSVAIMRLFFIEMFLKKAEIFLLALLTLKLNCRSIIFVALLSTAVDLRWTACLHAFWMIDTAVIDFLNTVRVALRRTMHCISVAHLC